LEIDLKKNGRILIVHHWDCDGICSAALIIRYLLELNSDINISTDTGDIGKYYLTSEKLEAFKSMQPDHIILCDYALVRGDILSLKALAQDLIIFDHHKQEEVRQAVHMNPFLGGDIEGLMYPSTGWVINSHLSRPQEILSVLGAVGDQEDLVRGDNTVNRVLGENGLDFGRAQEIVTNIDSCYITGDKAHIRRLVRLLSDISFDVKMLLDDKSLLDNRQKIGSALRDIVEGDKDIDEDKKTVYVSYGSSYHIISNVARELARRFPGYLAIVLNDPGKGEANIYFRTRRDMDLRPVIDLAHKKGYNAGGKKEVAGVMLPGRDAAGFIGGALGVLGLGT
jgi:single-stranded DNA-specific DHH superfamily exonuclease